MHGTATAPRSHEKESEWPDAPFLKWAGGKRWLFRRYRHLFPEKVERLIDPFTGGGSAYYYLRPKRAVLSDINRDLMAVYSAVRDYPVEVARILLKHQKKHSVEHYYITRRLKPMAQIAHAAWFIYLNRTCWNGLYRVNLDGVFNVPKGTKTNVCSSEDELVLHALVLRRASIRSADFIPILARATKGDLVFADPPYFEQQPNGRFVKYTAPTFTWEDQVRLRDAIVAAAARGATCYLTNSNSASLLSLYDNVGIFHELERQSVVSGSPSGRRRERELLVEVR